MKTSPVLEVHDLCRSWGNLRAVSKVCLSLASGERRVIFGANGAGKSTLLNMLAGDVVPSSGQIVYNGRAVTHMPSWKRARLGIRRTYQRSAVFPGLTVLQNLQVAIAGAQHGRFSFRRHPSSVIEHAAGLAERVRLSECRGRVGALLSHGQQRQLELGMALAGEANLLLLDEPAAGLSHTERQLLAGLIRELPKTVTLLFIEHDVGLAISLAETATVMHNGEVVEDCAAREVGSSAKVREIYLGASR